MRAKGATKTERKIRFPGETRHWARWELNIMVKMAIDGKSRRDIADALDRTRNSVIGRMNRMGIDEAWLAEQRGLRPVEIIVIPDAPPIYSKDCPHEGRWQPFKRMCAECIRRAQPRRQRGWTGLGGIGMSSLA